MKRLPYFAVALYALILLLASCGGGSGEDTASAFDNGTGFITLSVGDDAIDDFDQAIFEINRVTLIGGENGQITLLDQPKTIDFLALETVNEVLAEAEIPAGSYSKIRFDVASITLNELDDAGQVVRSETVDLVANGKVDIVPRGEFYITTGEALALAIDIDLEKSIKVHTTGNGRYKFRPVIFAHIVTEERPGRLVRLAGQFEAIEDEGIRLTDRAKICEPELMADDDETSESEDCRLVTLRDSAGVFQTLNGTLTAATFNDLNNGEQVVAYGFLKSRRSRDDDDDDICGATLEAIVFAEGQFTHAEGEATSAFDTPSESFDMVSDRDFGNGTDLNTHLPLSQQAVLVNMQGEPLNSSVIAPGVAVEAEGLYADGTPNTLDAFITIVDTTPVSQVISGTALDLTGDRLTLDVLGSDACAIITLSTVIQQLNTSVQPSVVEPGSFADLLDAIAAASLVEVTGVADAGSGCLQAETLLLGVEPSI